jgi:hypothetical protein
VFQKGTLSLYDSSGEMIELSGEELPDSITLMHSLKLTLIGSRLVGDSYYQNPNY